MGALVEADVPAEHRPGLGAVRVGDAAELFRRAVGNVAVAGRSRPGNDVEVGQLGELADLSVRQIQAFCQGGGGMETRMIAQPGNQRLEVENQDEP